MGCYDWKNLHFGKMCSTMQQRPRLKWHNESMKSTPDVMPYRPLVLQDINQVTIWERDRVYFVQHYIPQCNVLTFTFPVWERTGKITTMIFSMSLLTVWLIRLRDKAILHKIWSNANCWIQHACTLLFEMSIDASDYFLSWLRMGKNVKISMNIGL